MRFEVGELARVILDLHGNPSVGSIVEITEVGPVYRTDEDEVTGWWDYVADPIDSASPWMEDGMLFFDVELAKIEPPGEMDSKMQSEGVSTCHEN